ncbi:hypothetical protein L3Q82_004207 [Scortum barcoo]|uniref:Uncharacterized protein n=1 Tax=Scortum barcoo TaxID=214431 RepID=A0ACB8VLH3_9TELE|nr:hypothetical protein L3Q82_004207 [Scortum barcoo]
MESLPSRSTIKYPSQGTPRRPGTLYCCLAHRHKQQQETYPPNPKAQGSDPLVHWGELQHMTAELGSYKQAHTSSAAAHPGQLQSSGGSSPSQGAGFQSPSYAWRPPPQLLPKPHCTGPSWTFLRMDGEPTGRRAHVRHFGLRARPGPVGKDPATSFMFSSQCLIRQQAALSNWAGFLVSDVMMVITAETQRRVRHPKHSLLSHNPTSNTAGDSAADKRRLFMVHMGEPLWPQQLRADGVSLVLMLALAPIRGQWMFAEDGNDGNDVNHSQHISGQLSSCGRRPQSFQVCITPEAGSASQVLCERRSDWTNPSVRPSIDPSIRQPKERSDERTEKREAKRPPAMASADGLGSLGAEQNHLSIPVTDHGAWATAMNNLGIMPVGISGQQLVSDSVCIQRFDPGLGLIAPINPMMAGISLVPPPPVPPDMPVIKEIIHCKSCTLFPQNPNLPPPSTRERPPGCKTVFVGGLPENATEEIIREVFDQCGEIIAIRKSKKNFCHIRFSEEFMVDKAIYLSGYRMRIGSSTDKKDSGRIHVDFAQARDDLYEWECKQRLLAREERHRRKIHEDRLRPPSPPPIVHYSEHEAARCWPRG